MALSLCLSGPCREDRKGGKQGATRGTSGGENARRNKEAAAKAQSKEEVDRRTISSTFNSIQKSEMAPAGKKMDLALPLNESGQVACSRRIISSTGCFLFIDHQYIK